MGTVQIGFTKAQKTGIVFLLFLIILLQILILYFDQIFPPHPLKVEAIPTVLQKQYDSLQQIAIRQKKRKIYPFNPNFLSENKAYFLGINLKSLEKIEKYRASGKYFQTKEEFKKISGLSDSLFAILEPYISIPKFNKYPGYYQSSNKITSKNINLATASDLQTISGIGPVLSNRIIKYRTSLGGFSNKKQLNQVYGLDEEVIKKVWEVFYLSSKDQREIVKKNINTATMEDLIKINGIGEKLATRILSLREKNGGFVIKEELNTVYGLQPEVIDRLWKQFELKNPQEISRKISLNESNIKELAQHPYIDYSLAKKIVSYRTLHGGFKDFQELLEIEGFPKSRLKVIKIYLKLN